MCEDIISKVEKRPDISDRNDQESPAFANARYRYKESVVLRLNHSATTHSPFLLDYLDFPSVNLFIHRNITLTRVQNKKVLE